MEEQITAQEITDTSEAGGGIEERARRMGWTDQDEFRGHPDRWVDASTYVERTNEHLPILKGTLTTMEKKMVEQERLIKDQSRRLEEMQADVKEFVGYTRLAEERAYQKALTALKAEQRTAVEEQDLSKFDQISADIDEHIKGYAVVSKTTTTDSSSPGGEKVGAKAEDGWAKPGVFEAWTDENKWYKEKPKMATYAYQLDRWLNDNRPGLSQKERLEEITKMVKEEFPEYWSNTRRNIGPTVEGSGDVSVNRAGGKKSYADLPAEAKAACDKFAGKDGTGKTGSIPGYTRADYCKDYDWGV